MIHKQAWFRAYELIQNLVSEYQKSGISHLPNIRALALRCNVTPITARRVLRELEKDGIVTIKSRVGIYLKAPSTVPVSDSHPCELNHARSTPIVRTELSTVLAKDIHCGQFRHDRPLPSFKELRLKYGASYPMLRRSLLAVAETGLIQRSGRGYRLHQSTPRPTRGTIVLITRSGDWADLCTYTPRSAEFWRVLEQESLRANIVVDLVSYPEAIEALRLKRAVRNAASSQTGDILGHLIWVLGLMPDELQEIGIQLSTLGVPAAYLDEIGDVPVPMVIRRNPLMLYLSMATTPRAGEAVGIHLSTLRHQRIAYISPVTGHNWYDNRGTGISSVYQRIGISNAVTVFSLPELKNFGQVNRQLENDPPYMALLNHQRQFADFYSPHATGQEQVFYQTLALEMLASRFWSGRLEPLFEKALCDHTITAWVGMNDVIALLAMDFLTRRGVAVPGRISVCGFDDSLDALGRGLTSYNYNVPAVVRAMMDHILRPSDGTAKMREFPSEIDGTVMERRSSGATNR